MKTVVLVGMSASLVAAVVAFVAGVLVVGYIAIGSGLVWLAVAVRQAHPRRWVPAEVEHGVGGRSG